jgi:hypothetical protein
VLGQRRLAARQVDRRSLLRSGLGQQKGSGLEVKRGEAELAGELGAQISPPEPARDHQVDDHERLVLQLEDDALAEASKTRDPSALELTNRRGDGAQNERAFQPDLFQTPVENTRL